MKKLLSIPTLVESPYILAKVGTFTFGLIKKDSYYNYINVNYPNYMVSLNIVKVNGEVNTYTLRLHYQIQAGDDPNKIDKIFSQVSDTRKMILSYGDYNAPGYFYREEETLISNVQSQIDFISSSIDYTVTAVSTCVEAASATYTFPQREEKGSDVLKELLSNAQYKLTSIFPGLQNKLNWNQLIASDDEKVQIQAQNSMNILEYIQYVVSCMTPIQIGNNGLSSGVYKLSIIDDNKNKYGGSYFSVQKIGNNTVQSSQQSGINNISDCYEIDIGFPGDNFITNFSIDDTEQWSILYNLSEKQQQDTYQYSIDAYGNLKKNYSPTLTRSKSLLKTTSANKSWWTEVTKFPINAKLTLKGLCRPSMLMSYIKLNVVFYGQRHISSGIYIITGEIDKIDSSGYSTELSLTRVGGDE